MDVRMKVQVGPDGGSSHLKFDSHGHHDASYFHWHDSLFKLKLNLNYLIIYQLSRTWFNSFK